VVSAILNSPFAQTYERKTMPTYQLWLNDRDENGTLIDNQILDAARTICPAFFRYRQRELGCESLTNTLVQSAVAAASHANHGRPIENATGYLLSVFARKVNKFLARQARTITVQDSSLDRLTGAEHPHSDSSIEQRISILEVLDCMDAGTRQIFSWRIEGYSMAEIAVKLSITRNCLSVRYARGLRRTANRLKQSEEAA
jgi:DNA-directed RNA polymerase specialized sigma24 family protein